MHLQGDIIKDLKSNNDENMAKQFVIVILQNTNNGGGKTLRDIYNLLKNVYMAKQNITLERT